MCESMCNVVGEFGSRSLVGPRYLTILHSSEVHRCKCICKQMLDLKTSKTQTSQGFHRAATLQLSCLATCVVPIMAMSMTESGSCASMLQRQRTLNQTALPELQIDDRIRCLGCGEIKKTPNAIPAICF